MKIVWQCALVAASMLVIGQAVAQAPAVWAEDAESLFRSNDPKLHTNKQTAYHIIKNIPQATTTEVIDKYLTERYIQHNPYIPSGRAGMKQMFAIMKPLPATEKMTEKVIAVVAEGDYVVVSSVQEVPDPKNPGKTTTTTHFDMWRMKDGQADEHWDSPPPAGLGPPPSANAPSPAQ